MEPAKKSNREQQEEWEYIGNIWGWKFSFIGLAVIVSLCLFMWYRYTQLEVKPDNFFAPKNEIATDSLETK